MDKRVVVQVADKREVSPLRSLSRKFLHFAECRPSSAAFLSFERIYVREPDHLRTRTTAKPGLHPLRLKRFDALPGLLVDFLRDSRACQSASFRKGSSMSAPAFEFFVVQFAWHVNTECSTLTKTSEKGNGMMKLSQVFIRKGSAKI